MALLKFVVLYNEEDGNMGGHKDGKIYINLAYQDGKKETMMEVMGDELSHYVDYKNGNERSELESNNSETDVSRQYGDNAAKQTAGYVGDETFTNSETFKDQLANLDFSAVNQEVASVEGMDRRKYEVVVDSFIPYETVPAIPYSPDGIVDFHGDNRGPFEEGTSRMKQTFIVETDPNKSQDPLLSQKTDSNSTTMKLFGKDIMNGQANPDFEGTNITRTDLNGGDNVLINANGKGKNPIIPGAPSIDYQYEIHINPGTGDQSNPQISIKGAHDGFPAHTIQVTDIENGNIYQPYKFLPENNNQTWKLYPEKDIELEIPMKNTSE